MAGQIALEMPPYVASHFIVATCDPPEDPMALVRARLPEPWAGVVADLTASDALRIRSATAGASGWYLRLLAMACGTQSESERLLGAGHHLLVSLRAEPERQPEQAQAARAVARLLAAATDGVIADDRTNQVVSLAGGLAERREFRLSDDWLAVFVVPDDGRTPPLPGGVPCPAVPQAVARDPLRIPEPVGVSSGAAPPVLGRSPLIPAIVSTRSPAPEAGPRTSADPAEERVRGRGGPWEDPPPGPVTSRDWVPGELLLDLLERPGRTPTVRLVTAGLHRFGLPELLLPGVPPDSVPHTINLLRALATRLLHGYWNRTAGRRGGDRHRVPASSEVTVSDLRRYWGSPWTWCYGASVRLRMEEPSGDLPVVAPYLTVGPQRSFRRGQSAWISNAVVPVMPALADSPGPGSGGPW
ncbi:hypothetical protein [Rhizohabitans arisaemae]|uniref:hypothetical protein n=1 Tax=Rhizohabitans arisaemae TaxID=2720610 RepID=UPI0024B0EFAD|nr:hypothetical protein [Rhizohabitans arisaemae]